MSTDLIEDDDEFHNLQQTQKNPIMGVSTISEDTENNKNSGNSSQLAIQIKFEESDDESNLMRILTSEEFPHDCT